MSRTALALAAAACLITSTFPALAGAPEDAAQQVDIMGRGSPILRSDQFEAMRGEYALSDGGRLWIEGGRTRPTATLGDSEPVLLVPTGPNRFTSADGRLQLEFHAHRNGSIDGLTLTTGSRLQIARR